MTEHAQTMPNTGTAETDARPDTTPAAVAPIGKLVERTFDGVVELDDSGRITYASPAAERIAGRSLQELLGNLFWDYFDQAARERTRASFSEFVRGNRNVDGVETVILRPDGSSRDVEVNTFQWHREGLGRRVCAVFRDITERKRSEERVAEQRDELEQEVEERTTDLRRANERLVAEIAVRSTAEEKLKHNNAYLKAMNEVMALALEQTELDDVLDRALELILDLPAFSQAWGGGMFVVDAPQTLTIKAWRGRDGSGDSHHVGEQIPFDRCFCGQAATMAELMHLTRIDDRGRARCEVPVQHLHCCLPFRYQGEVLGMLSLLLSTDCSMEEWEVRLLSGMADALAGIVARVRGEQERQALVEQLQYSQRLEAVGRLAGGVAHDFNNLLTVIQGNVFLNLSDPELPVELRRDLQGIEEAANRAATLTRQLLAFGRRQVLRPIQVDVSTVVRELEKMLRRVIREDIALEVSLQDESWLTQVDPGQLEQVLLSLAVNARDAMPTGGCLYVETTNVVLTEADHSRPGGPEPGEYVRLLVRDTGVGMDAATLDRAFEPFFTTKDVGQGSGLGLSTAYGIVRQSDGFIWARSELGKGTEIEIVLPRCSDDNKLESPINFSLLRPSTPKTVLLAEDEGDVRKLVARVLERNGFRVLEARDGPEALALAKSHEDELQLLLTDVVMPGMSGVELARHVAEHRPALPVLYISGYTDSALLERGVSHPGDLLLEKPFTPEELVRRVHKILASRRRPPAA